MKKTKTIAGGQKQQKLVAVVLLGTLLLALFWFFQHREPSKVVAERPSERIPVSVALISKAAVRDSFSTVGTVEAFREAIYFLNPQVSSAGFRLSRDPLKRVEKRSLFLMMNLLLPGKRRPMRTTVRRNGTLNATKISTMQAL